MMKDKISQQYKFAKPRPTSDRIMKIISDNYDELRSRLSNRNGRVVGIFNFEDMFSETLCNIVSDRRIWNAPEEAVLKNFIYKFRMIEFRTSAQQNSRMITYFPNYEDLEG